MKRPWTSHGKIPVSGDKNFGVIREFRMDRKSRSDPESRGSRGSRGSRRFPESPMNLDLCIQIR